MNVSLENDLLNQKPLVELPRAKVMLYSTILYLLFASDLWVRIGINALLPLIQVDLGLSDTQVGMLGSLVLIGMMVFVLPVSYLADKWSKRGTICIMGLTWSLGTLVCGLLSGFGALAFGRFLVGAGNSSYAPASVSTLTNWYPKKAWGKVIGIYNTSIQLGISGGFLLTGLLASMFHWQTTFIIIAIPGFVLALLALLIPAQKTKQEEAQDKVSLREAFQVIFRNRTLMSTALATTFFNVAAMSFITFGPIFFMREMNMDVATAASLLGAIGLTGFIAFPLGGFLLDFCYRRDIRSRGWFPAICLIVSAGLLVLGYWHHSLILLTCGTFILSMVPTCYHVITQEIVPPRYRASSYGALVIFLQLGGAVGSTLTGILSQAYGIQMALMYIHTSLIISAACFLIAALSYRHDFAQVQKNIND